jgi:hypothetical protein
VQTWEAIAIVVIGGILARAAYVALVRHRQRGWPRVDRRRVDRRKLDRREMRRLDREYGQDREDQ